jgi:hypothetical protein
MKKLTKEELVENFAEATIAQTEAIMVIGSAKLSNKAANKIILCVKKLFALGDDGKDELSRLFKHERPDVRCTVAAFLLKYKTDESLKVLKQLSKLKGLVAFEAQEAIKRWEEGNWHLDEF